MDLALRDFYQSALSEVTTGANVEEDALRQWFETELITEVGTRGLVFRGKEATGGVPSRVLIFSKTSISFEPKCEAGTAGTS